MRRIAIALLLLALAAIAAQGATGPDYTLRTRGDLAAGVDDSFRFVVDPDTPSMNLNVQCPDDCDVFLAFNRKATRDDFDAAGTSSTGSETLDVSSPASGDWYVLVTSPTGVVTSHETYLRIDKDDYVAGETDATTHRMEGIDVEITAADFGSILLLRKIRPGRLVDYNGQPSVTSRSMTVHFFNPAIPEATMKITDGCDMNDHYWLFGMAGTTAEFTVTATQVATGQVVEWINEAGNPAPAFTDTSAFDCEPRIEGLDIDGDGSVDIRDEDDDGILDTVVTVSCILTIVNEYRIVVDPIGTYSYDVANEPEGMGLDEDTGMIGYSPPCSDAGQTFTPRFSATDGVQTTAPVIVQYRVVGLLD